MLLLFVGDVVGTPGIRMARTAIPWLRAQHGIDCVVVNAENASAGSGLYPNTYKQLKSAGIDALTMGDHIYKRVEIISLMQHGEPICKPANFPAEAPGRDHLLVVLPGGIRVGVISLMGRTYMRPVDCPFRAADRILASMPADVKCILVDVHAEATADKYLLGRYLDGRVSAVIGTHTHVPTADEQILPGGTAFLCDVGMTGPYGGILGRRVDRVLSAALDFVPVSFDVAEEDPRLAAALIDIDELTGKARSIRRLMVTSAEVPELP